MKHLRGQPPVAGSYVPILQMKTLRLQELRELAQSCTVFCFPFLFHITPPTKKEPGRIIMPGVHTRQDR